MEKKNPTLNDRYSAIKKMRARINVIQDTIETWRAERQAIEKEMLTAEIEYFKEAWKFNESNKDKSFYEDAKKELTEYGNMLKEQVSKIKTDKAEAERFMALVMGEA